MKKDLREAIAEYREVFNGGSPEAVFRELDEGRPQGAAELLENEGLTHESAMNARTAQGFYALAARVGREA